MGDIYAPGLYMAQDIISTVSFGGKTCPGVVRVSIKNGAPFLNFRRPEEPKLWGFINQENSKREQVQRRKNSLFKSFFKSAYEELGPLDKDIYEWAMNQTIVDFIIFYKSSYAILKYTHLNYHSIAQVKPKDISEKEWADIANNIKDYYEEKDSPEYAGLCFFKFAYNNLSSSERSKYQIDQKHFPSSCKKFEKCFKAQNKKNFKSL